VEATSDLKPLSCCTFSTPQRFKNKHI